MFHPRHFRTRHGVSVGAALALLLLVISHIEPRRTSAARSARQEGQSQQIPTIPPGEAYRQKNLISEVAGLTRLRDPLLLKPWGMMAYGGGTASVANHGTNSLMVYDSFTINLEHISLNGGPPTGMHANSFDAVIATTSGDILSGRPGRSAAVVASRPGHFYTGVAVGNDGSSSHTPNRFAYAADFVNGKIDAFDKDYLPSTFPADFADPTIPAGYRPYNVWGQGGSVLYVAYAKAGVGGADEPGAGHGYVRKFSGTGVRDPAFAIDGGALNSPWGMVISPTSFGQTFGQFTGALLVGNYGDGKINAYDPDTGAFRGTLRNDAGEPLVNEHLRALDFDESDFGSLYFTSGFGDEGRGLLGNIRVSVGPPDSLLQFAADSFTIGEGQGHVDITVTRAGNISETVRVDFAAFDVSGPGHASQRSDYESVVGRLTFAPGETSKTFRVLLIDDGLSEGDEVINLALSNPGLGFTELGDLIPSLTALGSPAYAELKIKDNDSIDAATNPIDNSQFFVRQQYLDFLGREPDPAGLAFWVNEIESCGADAACREARRVNVSAAFFLSIEFERTALTAYYANRASYETRPDYWQILRDHQQLQRGYTFGEPGAEARLEANKVAYFEAFVRTPEFGRKFIADYSPSAFVNDLYMFAGFTAGPVERQAAINEFGGAARATDLGARARALRRISEHIASGKNGFFGFPGNEHDRTIVTMEYYGYLRRDPDADGFNFWVGKLDLFFGDIIRAEMVKAFINSDEYRHRFGP